MENYKENNDFLNDIIDDFNLTLLKYVLKKSLIWIIILFIACFGIGQLKIRYTAPIYEANSSMILKKAPETMKILGIDGLLQSDDAEVQREIQLLRSGMIMRRVLDSLNLSVSYFKTSRLGLTNTEYYKNSPFEIQNFAILNKKIYDINISLELIEGNFIELAYKINGIEKKFKYKQGRLFLNEDFSGKITILSPELMKDKFHFVFKEQKNLITELTKDLTVSQISPQTQSMQITFKDINIERATDIVSVMTNTFISFDQERKAESVSHILDFLKYQIDTFNSQFTNFKDTSSFSDQSSLLSTPQERVNAITTKIEQLEQELDKQKNKIELINNVINQPTIELESYISAYISSNEFSSHFFELMKEVSNMSKRKEELLLDYKPTHPNILIIDNKIAKTSEAIKEEIASAKLIALDRKNLIHKKLKMLEGELMEYPSQAEAYSKYKKENESKEKFIFNLLDKKAQYLVAEAGIVPDYIILTQANCNGKPISPNVQMIQVVSIGLFVLLSLFLVFARYFTYQFVTSVKEVKKRLKAPVLGVIPRYYDENMERSKIVVTLNPKSKISEAFRGIRANIQFISGSNKGCKVVSTTSTIPGEGKTFVNINLAAIHAVLDKKVVLLDLDMRKPRLSKIFGIQSTHGMSTILSGQSSYEDCIHSTNIKNLDVIPAGPVPPNPSELVLTKRLDVLLEALKEKYDFIFIDTPPIGLVTDAMEVLAKCDAPLYVIRADYTKKEFLVNIDRLIVENKLSKLSIVVNDFGKGASGEMYEYGYGYGYTYSQGEGYYTDDHKRKKDSWIDYLKNWKL